MKTLLITGMALASVSAVATVELSAQMLNKSCVIRNGKVTTTQTFGKEKDLSFTTTREMSLSGVEKYAQIAASTSSPTPVDAEYSYALTLDGTSYSMNQEDSKASLYLIQLLTKACN